MAETKNGMRLLWYGWSIIQFGVLIVWWKYDFQWSKLFTSYWDVLKWVLLPLIGLIIIISWIMIIVRWINKLWKSKQRL